MHTWNDLTPHEQLVLKAIYTTHQGQARNDKRKGVKNLDSSLPFRERGWLNYHPIKPQTESYLQTALGRTLNTEQVTTLFENLITYGLIDCKYTVVNEVSVQWIKMTPNGHKIALTTFIYRQMEKLKDR